VLRQECRQLEEREAELRQQLETDDGIAVLLQAIGEERATAAAESLGWGEDDGGGGHVGR
jgi:hypothetical protein